LTVSEKKIKKLVVCITISKVRVTMVSREKIKKGVLCIKILRCVSL